MNPATVLVLAAGLAMPELLKTKLLASVRPAASASSVPVVRASVPVPKAVLLPTTVMRLPVEERAAAVGVVAGQEDVARSPARNSAPGAADGPGDDRLSGVGDRQRVGEVPAAVPVLVRVIGPAKIRLLLPAMVTELLLKATGLATGRGRGPGGCR